MAAGSYALEMRDMSLKHSLEGVVRNMQAWARTDGILLSLEFDASIPPIIVGDPNRVGQIVSNYISNALKFVAHDGTGE